MRKIRLLVFILIILGIIGYFGFKNVREELKEQRRIEKIKEGWYLEITCEGKNVCDDIKVKQENKKVKTYKNARAIRSFPGGYGDLIKGAQKGEVYKILEVDESDNNYLWYRVSIPEAEKGEGYISEPRRLDGKVVKVYNNPEGVDYAAPNLSFDNDEYYVDAIEDINYDHLTLWDDQDGYTVSHVVYKEEHPTDRPGPQYWIEYTITDKVGKMTSKLQRIVFKYPPTDDKAKDFDIDYLP